MKRLLLISFALVIIAVTSVCQTPSAKVQGFRWSWRDTQTAKNALATDTKLSTDVRASLLNAIANQFKGDPQARNWAAETRIKMADLNGDGVSEIIAQGVGDICSPTGNCPFWVFQKTASGYSKILARGAIQSFTIQPTRTNGYSDLVLEMHGSATEQGLYLYEFRQGKYRPTGCYDANWTYLDKNNKIHDLKEPRITPCRWPQSSSGINNRRTKGFRRNHWTNTMAKSWKGSRCPEEQQ